MSITDTDLADLDPTEADLLAEQDDTLLDTSDEDDEWTWEDDYSPRDDRYDGDGIPSWSAWAQ